MPNLRPSLATTRPRRRRPQKQKHDKDTAVVVAEEEEQEIVVMDSDDQARLVADLTNQIAQQQRGIQQAFRVVCGGAASLSVLCCWFVQRRQTITTSQLSDVVGTGWWWPAWWLRWIHALLAVAMHGVAYYVATAKPSLSCLKWVLYMPFAVMMLVAVNGLFVLRHLSAQQQDTNNTNSPTSDYYDENIWLHQGMLLVNVLTAATGLWLRHDILSMQQSLEELKQSQYRYKSL